MKKRAGVKLSEIRQNEKNPRKISPEALDRLKRSIERDPEFMRLRPIVVDGDGMILGGNQRYAAIKALGMKEIPAAWVVAADWIDDEKRRRFVLVDNAPGGMAGEWDVELLMLEWKAPELLELGVEAPEMVDACPIDRPDGDRAGASPWDRVGQAGDGVMFSFGAIQRRLSVDLYDLFARTVGPNNLEEWLNANLYH